ncbi:MAG: PepSY domain-containing protein, partial [Thermoplasmata archaeon]
SFLFNDLSVDVRGSDLRVMFVGLCVWYRQSGNPEVSASDAVGIALGIARSEHNATDPSGLTLTVAVRNGESFVYNVYVHWSGECSMDWTLEVWVDATTGEVLAQEGPQEVCVYTADPSGLLLFLFGLIVVIVTVVAVVIVEARVRKKKAKR